MAGANMEGGQTVGNQTVPSISETGTAEVVAGGHVSGNRSEGVAYPENFGVDVTTRAYPGGTAMNDTTPGDVVN